MYQHGIKNTLKAGSIVFGASAVFLLIAPALFLDLLGADNSNPMIWSMRMIAITLLALAGNMWQNAKLNNASSLGFVAKVMFIAAAGLGFLTIFIPNELTPFAIAYAIIGFGFSISYLVNLIRK
jgi:hypothetical protein